MQVWKRRLGEGVGSTDVDPPLHVEVLQRSLSERVMVALTDLGHDVAVERGGSPAEEFLKFQRALDEPVEKENTEPYGSV